MQFDYFYSDSTACEVPWNNKVCLPEPEIGVLKLVPVHSLVNETRKPVSESNSAYDVANSPSTGDPFEVIKDNVRLYHTSPQIETLNY